MQADILPAEKISAECKGGFGQDTATNYGDLF